jgi:hypothetical protein
MIRYAGTQSAARDIRETAPLHCAARHCTALPCCLLPSRPIPSRARTDATSAACFVCVCVCVCVGGRVFLGVCQEPGRGGQEETSVVHHEQRSGASRWLQKPAHRHLETWDGSDTVRSFVCQSVPINTRAPVSPVDFECVHLSSLRAAAGAGAGAAPGYPRHTHASTTCFYRSTNRWSN